MSTAQESTTLSCLFHHHDHAEATLQNLHKAGILPASIVTIAADYTGNTESHLSALEQLGVPERDLKHLHEGLHDGGTIVAVQAISDHVGTVQRIFAENKAEKIDEIAAKIDTPANTASTAISIVEEELAVGKRTVDQGGVRVYRRVVEMPAEASVALREEHVVIERKPVDRAATAADFSSAGRVIELTETAEEAVIGKTAHVVEEVIVGKQISQQTEHITDTVRKTQVDVEDLPPTERAVTNRTF